MKYIVSFTMMVLLSYWSFGQQGSDFVDSVDQTIESTKEELIKIKEGYYIIQPAGLAGNVGVYVGTQGVTLVDDQWAKLVPQIKELIRTITEKPVKYIINTHYHFDHVDGNKAFGREKVSIVAQENLRKRLLKDQVISGSPYGDILQNAYPPEGLPSIVFRDSLQLHDERENVRILHFPNAHTDGDAIVHFQEADIYHTGDIFVTYGLPVLDEKSGGDIYSMIAAIKYLLGASGSETRFIPGHGPVCTRKELLDYYNLLTSIRDQVEGMVKRGASLNEVVKGVKIDVNIGGVDKTQFVSHVYRMAIKHEKVRGKSKAR